MWKVTLFALVFVVSCAAEERELETKSQLKAYEKNHNRSADISIGTTFSSKYVGSRRQLIVNNFCIFPTMIVNWANFNAEIWSLWQLSRNPTYPSRINGAGKLTEIDYIIGYTFHQKKISITPGFINLVYPHTGNKSAMRCRINLEYNGPFKPFIFVERNIKLMHGWEFSFGAQKKFHLFKLYEFPIHLNFVSAMSYRTADVCNHVYNVNKTTWTDIYLFTTLEIKLNNNFSLSPFINVSSLIAPSIRHATKQPDLCWYGFDFTLLW